MGPEGKNNQPTPHPHFFSQQQALRPGSRGGGAAGLSVPHACRWQGPFARVHPAFSVIPCEKRSLPVVANARGVLHPGRGPTRWPSSPQAGGLGCHRQSCQSVTKSLVTCAAALQDEFLELEFLGRRASGVTWLIGHPVFCHSRNCLHRRPQHTSCPHCTGPRTIFLWTPGRQPPRLPAAIGVCERCGPAIMDVGK